MSAFGRFLLLACTLMQVYVFWRAMSVPAIVRIVPRKYFLLIGVLLWFVSVLRFAGGHHGTGTGGALLELFAMDWLAELFLISFCLLIVDFITAFGYFMRAAVPILRTVGLIAGIAFAIVAMALGTMPPIVRNYDVRPAQLPPERDGMVIVALSDLHLGTLLRSEWLRERIMQVQQLHPDLIVLLGDLLEGHGENLDYFIPDLRRLSAPLGVYAVPGNHESFGNQADSERVLNAAGIITLLNQSKEIAPGISLAGVEDLTMNQYVGHGNPIATALRVRPPGTTILLSHSPLHAEDAAAAGVGLMLSGHTHGGQIWPFNYLVQRMYPRIAGRYDIHGMTLIVSRGTGTWGPRMRLWHRAEILRIVLHR